MINEFIFSQFLFVKSYFFMLILTDDFFNFIKIMKFLFEIGSQYLVVKMEWLKKCLRGYLIYVILGYESILFFKLLFIYFKIIYTIKKKIYFSW